MNSIIGINVMSCIKCSARDIDMILLGILNTQRKNGQAHGYRCSFHLGVFQGIDFPWGT